MPVRVPIDAVLPGRAGKILAAYRLQWIAPKVLEHEYDCSRCTSFAQRNCTGPQDGCEVASPDGVWLREGWLYQGLVMSCPALGYRDDLALDSIEPIRACPMAGVGPLWTWLTEYKLYLDGHGPARDDMTEMPLAVYNTLAAERARQVESHRRVPRDDDRPQAGLR